MRGKGEGGNGGARLRASHPTAHSQGETSRRALGCDGRHGGSAPHFVSVSLHHAHNLSTSTTAICLCPPSTPHPTHTLLFGDIPHLSSKCPQLMPLPMVCEAFGHEMVPGKMAQAEGVWELRMPGSRKSCTNQTFGKT